MTEQAFHAVAELFPLLEGPEFEDLVADIRKNGLREEIWKTRAGLIIDGRNRFRACEQAKVKPRFRTWKGSEEEIPTFVASMNLHRRHLTDEQRAFIAARMANMERGEDARLKTKKGQKGFVPTEPPAGGSVDSKPLVTTDQAASTMQVTSRAVQRAKAVIKHAPELEVQVLKYEASLSAAAREAAARGRGEAAREVQQRHPKETLTRFEKGIAALRRFLIEFNDVKRLAPVAEFVRAFLREQERGR